MTDLVDFTQQVEDKLSNADRAPRWTPAEAAQYMEDVSQRRRRFEQSAGHCMSAVVQPRLEVVAASFSNAWMGRDDSNLNRTCRFVYCSRFPVEAAVAFSMRHDVQVQRASLCYEAWMAPLFIKMNERDKLTSPLGGPDDAQAAEWAEHRLLEFLEAYLRVDGAGGRFHAETSVDPVCGMRVARASAAADASYCGHPYFFCSLSCQRQFIRSPSTYVDVKTM